MKDFYGMTDEEFREAQKEADLILWSKYAIFARSLAGFSIFKGIFAVPKYIVFNKFKYKPRQLELIVEGKHPDYHKKPNYNFDTATWNILEVELELVSQLGTDPTCSNTRSGSSTSSLPDQSQ